MEIKDVQKKERKTIKISIRTYPSFSKWMREKGVSPNAIFDLAVRELMNKK